jgi:hypothetical protein
MLGLLSYPTSELNGLGANILWNLRSKFYGLRRYGLLGQLQIPRPAHVDFVSLAVVDRFVNRGHINLDL